MDMENPLLQQVNSNATAQQCCKQMINNWKNDGADPTLCKLIRKNGKLYCDVLMSMFDFQTSVSSTQTVHLIYLCYVATMYYSKEIWKYWPRNKISDLFDQYTGSRNCSSPFSSPKKNHLKEWMYMYANVLMNLYMVNFFSIEDDAEKIIQFTKIIFPPKFWVDDEKDKKALLFMVKYVRSTFIKKNCSKK